MLLKGQSILPIECSNPYQGIFVIISISKYHYKFLIFLHELSFCSDKVLKSWLMRYSHVHSIICRSCIQIVIEFVPLEFTLTIFGLKLSFNLSD